MNKRCIDYNSIQVKELSDELGLKPIIVAAKIAVWQDKNNTYDFPSANDLVEGILKSNEKTLNQTEITIGNKKYKQGIYSFKEIFENIGEKLVSEEVDFVFEQNSELEKIGTRKQYSEYLSTIFPNSKVKDILYHGTTESFDTFQVPMEQNALGNLYSAGLHFGTLEQASIFDNSLVQNVQPINPDNIKYEDLASKGDSVRFGNKNYYYNENKKLIESITSITSDGEFNTSNKSISFEELPKSVINTLEERKQKYIDSLNEEINKDKNKTLKIIPVLLNISKLYGSEDVQHNEVWDEILRKTIKTSTEGIVYENKFEGEGKSYIVTDSKQVYILGSKKDTEHFSEFVKNYKNPNNHANKLLKMLYGLSNQSIDNMKVEIVDNIVEAGHFDNGIIRLNVNSTNPETVFTHEVIHALTALKLAYWKKNSPKVYKDMEKVWIDSKAILDPSNTRYEFSSIDEFYAALSKQSFVEELAAIKDDSFIGKLIQMFKDMLSKLGIKVEGTLAERALNNLTNIVKSEIGSTDSQVGKLKIVDNKPKTYYQNNSGQSNQDFIASEKTIRDLAARLANRIGIEVEFISDRSQNFKGKLEGNIATINLAYATLDTSIHEILGHPIINAIKNKVSLKEETYNTDKGKESVLIEQRSVLYNNLLKELESGKGKEVLDRIKKDYPIRESNFYRIDKGYVNDKWVDVLYDKNRNRVEEAGIGMEARAFLKKLNNNIYTDSLVVAKYDLEEQQEEAIVELVSLMTAEKLDAVKDGKLISLLKRLLKEMATFMRNLLRQKEIEVDKLPDNMTLNDIANILAYSNSKIILPENEVIYTTPDNQTFKTYQEASNHISKLANSVKDVDLTNKNLDINEMPDYFVFNQGEDGDSVRVFKKDNKWFSQYMGEEDINEISKQEALEIWKDSIKYAPINEGTNMKTTPQNLQAFIEKNKEFEQSKEIIEEWKKVNSIKYNPEEIYSRGQGFYSVVGAYSQFDVKLMFQNLLHHIEDNKKAGGHFAISAFTKPIDKNISHLEGGGGKIKFVIYPKPEDILWATNRDAYSGSVWDAAEKVNKDKKSELLGVSYTKYPSLANINSVQPNLASIVDNLADHHNELGIVLSNNFRLEVDEDVPYEIKRLVGVVNSVLDDTYGKIKKPEIAVKGSTVKVFEVHDNWDINDDGSTKIINTYLDEKKALDFIDAYQDKSVEAGKRFTLVKSQRNNGIQPNITEKDLKESIGKIKDKVAKFKTSFDIEELSYQILEDVGDTGDNDERPFGLFINNTDVGGNISDYIQNFETREQAENWVEDNGDEYRSRYKGKEYNEQALINTKISALKEVAKKYPRSLIRSEVINSNNFNTYYQKSVEGGQEMQGKLSKDNVQVGDLIVNDKVRLRVTALNENDLTTEDGQTIPYDADFNVFRTAPNEEISNNKPIDDVPFNEHESELSENKPIEDLAMEEADNYIPLNPTEVEVATFDWVSKIVTSYEEMGKELSNVSRNNSGKTLYNDNVTHASKIRNINKEHATETELLKTIKQAASIVMYVSNLKYNLISKGEISTDNSAYTNVLNSNLLGLAKKIAADYKGDTSEWTDEQHKKYTEMAAYIRTYLDIHTNQSEIANLKLIMKQSRNQTEDINAYLKSIGQSSDYNSAAQDIQEVIDAMEEINLTLKYSTHFAHTLQINNKKEIAAKIASNNEVIEKKNNKILAKIALNVEKIVKNPEKKETLEEENEELRKGLKEMKTISSVQQIQNEMMDGNDNGFLKAVTGSIHDLGDASMTLLANRVEENFQKMQNRFAPMGKEMTDAWTDFSEDLGAVYDDEKVMKNFTEIIEYTDREGIERTEKHFISERDMKAYYEDYHKTANEIGAIGKEITELYKNISTKPVADEVEHKAQNDANDAIRAEIQGLRVKIAKIQKDFTEKLAFSKDKTDSYIDDNGDIAYYNNTIGDHFMRMLDDYKKANGEQGLQSFYHYVESNLDIKTMKYDNKSFRRNSEESYINHLIANSFKGDILVPKYSSKLLIPKKGSYPSNKLAALSASERKAFDIVTKIYYESQMDLPEYSRPGTRVPSVPKEYMQKNLKDKMAIGKILKQEFTDHFSDEISENDSKKIPIYYVGNSMNANEISDNYFGTVLMFAKQAAAFRAKADTLHLAKEMQYTLGKSKQQDRTGEIMINKSLAAMGITEAIPSGTDWRQWFLEKWIDGVFFGKTNTPISWKVGKHNVRIDKILNKFMGFSAFGTIGGVKIVNFFTNLGMANTANLMNTTGYFEGAKTEQLYSWVQYMKALYSGGKVMWDMLLDHVKQTEYSSSVYAELMDELEPLQGEYFDKFGNQLNRSFLGKAFSTTTWFAPSQFAEVQPQITAMIATLENIPVKLLDGSSTTLWKALTASNDLNANWQTIESSGDIVGWRNVREDVLINKKRKLEEVNRKLQGNYKSLGGINSPIMRQNVFGRMLENYKKWVVPGFLSRYKEDGYSINRNERDEGRYRVLFNYILSDAKWMWQSIGDKKVTPLDILWITPENIDRVRQYFTDEQIIAIRQAVIEQAFITFTSIFAVIFLAIGKGSDDDDYMFSTAAAITLKISRDFNYFQPLNIDTPFTTEFFLNEKPDDMGLSVPLTSGMQDVMRIAKNPFAVMRTLDQIDALFEILTSNPSATYVKGDNKGKLKVGVAGLKLIGVTTGTDGKIFTDPLSR